MKHKLQKLPNKYSFFLLFFPLLGFCFSSFSHQHKKNEPCCFWGCPQQASSSHGSRSYLYHIFSLFFFHLSLFFFSLSPLSLFFFPFIELFLSNDASWGGVTAQNFSGDHFGYSFPYDFNILIFFFCFCFLDVCLFSTSACWPWSLFFLCVWPR